jgi:hypothetical protein
MFKISDWIYQFTYLRSYISAYIFVLVKKLKILCFKKYESVKTICLFLFNTQLCAIKTLIKTSFLWEKIIYPCIWRAVIDEYGAVVEWWMEEENWRKRNTSSTASLSITNPVGSNSDLYCTSYRMASS